MNLSSLLATILLHFFGTLGMVIPIQTERPEGYQGGLHHDLQLSHLASGRVYLSSDNKLDVGSSFAGLEFKLPFLHKTEKCS